MEEWRNRCRTRYLEGRQCTPADCHDPAGVVVAASSVRIADGAIPLLKASCRRFPFVEYTFADAAYATKRLAAATRIAIEIVRKPANQVGFAVHQRRGVVERCFAWLGRNRRRANDFVATITSATAFLYAATVMLLLRRLARCA
jgi:hypothetical protein